jgi:hypothetical protein
MGASFHRRVGYGLEKKPAPFGNKKSSLFGPGREPFEALEAKGLVSWRSSPH